MYTQEQWLWDRELSQPVQYLGVEINLKGPAKWYVRENGVEKVYEFKHFKWWHDRYTHLLDGNDPTKILTGRTGSSQFYGGPFPDCIEIAVKPSQP